jgi:hypothetical protein
VSPQALASELASELELVSASQQAQELQMQLASEYLQALELLLEPLREQLHQVSLSLPLQQ